MNNLIISIMSSIDELKEKITDNEYLNLCNLLKSLNEENTKNKPLIKHRFNLNSGEDEDEFDENIMREICYFTQRTDIFNERGEIIITDEDLLIIFNEFLLSFYNPNNNKIFRCPCDCVIRCNEIREHLNDYFHNERVSRFFY